ncbi:hypothetical protein A2765_00100 [Candidatus Kaiserbacteria bacterium RIFCSPHIGHO2_01_FULL_56_24]|uniref:Tyrosine specific protein phosphatases domain-containing protein n=1 Tax=Candidatus Kaiserbacteria bacterium RIFCSPHIGHO2_01_FULL_56_24 TaxID=1798487 RepID=A0A1F6DBB6_9BACT|nr:MAG: hypothetical protein A2765_00100 [Candidatus Kaiserbacteria bacterium RIFCSPHIGHO2_01_FULL_56_24]
MSDNCKHGLPGEETHDTEDLFAHCGHDLPPASGMTTVIPAATQSFVYPAEGGYYGYAGGQYSPCQHYGDTVKVGNYTIWAGGAAYLKPKDLKNIDVLVPLLDTMMPFGFRGRYQVLALPLKDYGGVPPNWRQGVEDVIKELEAGRRVLSFCQGGHGRTGTLLASLVALLESVEQTPDPIEAVRERYCDRAVETRAQAEAVFALRGESLPGHYTKEFPKVYTVGKKKKKRWFFGYRGDRSLW